MTTQELGYVDRVDLADWHMWWKRSGAREMRAILMEAWDPIHVRGIPEAAGEYDGYLGQIAERLRAGASDEQIGEYLTGVEEDRMGLGESAAARERGRLVGERLVAWYAAATSPAAE